MYYAKEEALKKVKEYQSGTLKYKDRRPVTHLVIVPDIEDLSPIIAQYLNGQTNSEIIASLYGNGQNLRLYQINLPL